MITYKEKSVLEFMVDSEAWMTYQEANKEVGRKAKFSFEKQCYKTLLSLTKMGLVEQKGRNPIYYRRTKKGQDYIEAMSLT